MVSSIFLLVKNYFSDICPGKRMKRSAALGILTYFLFGTFCLPMGDFECLKDLPSMYRHCKSTEDKDMTPFDFITDHLVNIDGIFDKHNHGDQQKPHQPFHFPQQTHVINFVAFISTIQISTHVIPLNNRFISRQNFIASNYKTKIFHPPIV